MLKAQVQAITMVTLEGAGPPENNICSSYMSGMTRLVLVQEHPDSSEDATIPWKTYTMPPELCAAPAPSHLTLLSETMIDRGPRFNNITPASRCRLIAAAIACSLPSCFNQNDGEQSSSRTDSGAPTSSRKRG